MAAYDDDQPVLPGNFFHDAAQSGQWNWEADFTDAVEIGKGKVRAGRAGQRGSVGG